jgi:hypothetical protein
MNEIFGGKEITYRYLFISLVILFVVYYMLVNLRNNLHKKKNSLIENSILIESDDEVMRVKPDILDSHLNRLKDNLVLLNSSFDTKNCEIIRNYLENSHSDLQDFIRLQDLTNNAVSNDICSVDNDDIIIDSYIAKERKLIERKLMEKNDLIYRSDVDEEEEERKTRSLRFKLALYDIIIDIEVITFLIRNSICKNGKIDMRNIHELLYQLYNNNCLIGETEMQKDKAFPSLKMPIDNVRSSFEENATERFQGRRGPRAPARNADWEESSLVSHFDVESDTRSVLNLKKQERTGTAFIESQDRYDSETSFAPIRSVKNSGGSKWLDLDELKKTHDKKRSVLFEPYKNSLTNDYDYLENSNISY